MNGAIKVTVNQKQKKHSEMTDKDHYSPRAKQFNGGISHIGLKDK